MVNTRISSIDKSLFSWEEQQQQRLHMKSYSNTAILKAKDIIIIVFGAILFSALIAFLAVLIWRSRQRRFSKPNSEPSEATPFSSTNSGLSKPREMVLYPLMPKPAQFNVEDVNDNLRRQSLTKNGKGKSGKPPLQIRRGNPSPLTISVTKKPRFPSSSPIDSTSDEYLHTATRKLTIDELHQHAQDTFLLYQEFWAIPTNQLEKIRIYGAGAKNRYRTILANEHSRVKLPELSGDPLSSYINANYIYGWPNESRGFIATQGPLSNTIIDFYRMIWQERSPVIVMITRLFEKNEPKCERYIPELETNRYGPFYVQVESVNHHTDYEVRRWTIQFENEQHKVDHYWYTAWPDHSCPNVVQPLIELVHEVERSRIELSKINMRSGPVVVHCSAGIGRTGCFIALSNGIKQLNKEHAVDVLRILCNLRRDRGGMIQNNDQYQFVHQALSTYARTLQ